MADDPSSTTPIVVELPPDLLAALDTFIAGLPEPKPSRPEAIRQMLATLLNIVAKDRS